MKRKKKEGKSRSAGNQMRNDNRMNDHKYENLDRSDIGVIILMRKMIRDFGKLNF